MNEKQVQGKPLAYSEASERVLFCIRARCSVKISIETLILLNEVFGFRFSPVPIGKYGIVSKLRHGNLLSNPLQFITRPTGLEK